jgi:hypothetical protein
VLAGQNENDISFLRRNEINMAQTSKPKSKSGKTAAKDLLHRRVKSGSKGSNTAAENQPPQAGIERRRRSGPRCRGVKAFISYACVFFAYRLLYLRRLVYFILQGIYAGAYRQGFFLIPVALGFCALILVMFKDRPLKSRIILHPTADHSFRRLYPPVYLHREFTWSWKLPASSTVPA